MFGEQAREVFQKKPNVLAARGQCLNKGNVLAGRAELSGATGGAQIIEEVSIGANVFAPLLGNVVFIVDSFNRADRFAGAAVNAFIGVNVQGAVALVDAVNGAFFNACAVLDVYTGQSDDVGHELVATFLKNFLTPSTGWVQNAVPLVAYTRAFIMRQMFKPGSILSPE